MDLHLKDKRALVTGSSRGLGFATALELAMEGCQVAINSRSSQSVQAAAQHMAAQSGTPVLGLSGDLTDPVFPVKLVEQTAAEFGGLDILVTNTGGPPAGEFENLDDDSWQRAFELNFLSHMRLIRAALPHLRSSQCASVLTVTSFSVKQPIPNLSLSNSIRAATVGLTKSLALELGSQGIRFNSILPAWTLTERVDELMASRARMNQTSYEEEFAKQASESPFKRMGKPEEFAKAAVFLVSPAASFITGVMLAVDGGMYKGVH